MCCAQVATCWRCTRRLFLTALPWKLLADGAQFVGPVFLKLLLVGRTATVEEPGGLVYELLCLRLCMVSRPLLRPLRLVPRFSASQASGAPWLRANLGAPLAAGGVRRKRAPPSQDCFLWLFLRLQGVVAEEGGGSSGRGYAYAGAMLAGLLLGIVADNQQFQRCMRAGRRMLGEFSVCLCMIGRCLCTSGGALYCVPLHVLRWGGRPGALGVGDRVTERCAGVRGGPSCRHNAMYAPSTPAVHALMRRAGPGSNVLSLRRRLPPALHAHPGHLQEASVHGAHRPGPVLQR